MSPEVVDFIEAVKQPKVLEIWAVIQENCGLPVDNSTRVCLLLSSLGMETSVMVYCRKVEI